MTTLSITSHSTLRLPGKFLNLNLIWKVKEILPLFLMKLQKLSLKNLLNTRNILANSKKR